MEQHVDRMVRLSPYSQTFYEGWCTNPNRSDYNLVSDQDLWGTLDPARLAHALKRFSDDFIVLHSKIQNIGEQLYWVEDDSVFIHLDYFDNPQTEEKLLRYVRQPFNLDTGPFIRVGLVRLEPEHFRILLVFHHIVMDGAKVDFFFDNLSEYYNDDLYKSEYTVETQREKFKELHANFDYIKIDGNSAQAFWKSKLQDITGVDLRFLEPFNDRWNSVADRNQNFFLEHWFSFGADVVRQLQRLKKQYGVTPYLLGQVVFATLLRQYTGQNDFALCFPVRINEGVHFIYGAHLNVNIIPFRLSDEMTILDVLESTKIHMKEIKLGNYKYHPFQQVMSDVHDRSVLDVGFIQTHLREKPFRFNGISDVKINHNLYVDLLCRIHIEQELKNETISYRIRYDRRDIDTDLFLDFMKKYQKFFIQIVNDLQQPEFLAPPISEYKLLDQEQGKFIQNLCNPVRKSYPDHQTIHNRFEQQAARTPDGVALVCENTSLTYSELNKTANRLAHYLVRQSVIQPDDLVSVCVDRSEYTVIALLAVLKSGGGYVPIDLNYPDNRIAFILTDARPSVILTNARQVSKLRDLVSAAGQTTLVVSIDDLPELELEPETNLTTATNSQHLAYVIYTSGTTGNPKGVLQQHNNVIRLFEATKAWYQFNQHDVWTLFHSTVFDFSVWEIWGALLHGGKLVVPTADQIRDLQQFYELCHRENVTVLNLTPTVLYNFFQLACDTPDRKLSRLRYIISGGDKLNFLKLSDWLKLYGDQRPKIINMYGITETTVHVTYKEIKESDIGPHSLIGYPLPDQKVYVLDRAMNILPIGAVGELYVGGAGLARGYLNQTKLTQERFIPSPFQTVQEKSQGINSRLYKTGDLVRVMLDGSLGYLGRADTQLKIRGYRVESTEIETRLCAHPDIKQALVLLAEYQPNHETRSANLTSTGKMVCDAAPVDPQDQPAMLPIQEWFFAQDFKNAHHFNQSFLIRTPLLDIGVLSASLNELVNNHECFSLRFSINTGKIHPEHIGQSKLLPSIHQLDVATIPHCEGTKEFNDKIYDVLTGWQSHFDIVNGPLYSVGYIYGYADGSARVYFALHHLIVDVVSWHIIAHDLQKIYVALSSPQRAAKPGLLNRASPRIRSGISYQQWAQFVKTYGLKNSQERSYWLNVLDGHDRFDAQLNRLVGDNDDAGGSRKSQVFQSISFNLSKDETELILVKDSSIVSYHADQILLTTLALAVESQLNDPANGSGSRTNSVFITLEGHGREDVFSDVDLSHTPGWFTTMYPCRLNVESSNPLETLKSARDHLQAIPMNGLGYGALFGYHQGLPRVRFNYFGKLNNRDDNSETGWVITGEPSGQQVDHRNASNYIIDLVGWVAGGQLHFVLISQLNQNQTGRFVEIFKNKLMTLARMINQQTKSPTLGSRRDALKASDQEEFNRRLVAYYVSDVALEHADLGRHLAQHLPSWALPQEFIWMSAMPLTINGKVDIGALPKESDRFNGRQASPRNEKERLLCDVFAAVLSRKKIGIHDDFFDMGGDSISTITLVMQLQRHFHVNVRDVYSYRTPCRLAQNLSLSTRSIKDKLLGLMRDYQNPSTDHRNVNETIKANLNRYQTFAEELSPDVSPQLTKNVLLTGATGFLGSNLLYQLLNHTSYNVFLLTRAESDQLAFDRVNSRYQRYFSTSLQEYVQAKRVVVIHGDLEQPKLGLPDYRFLELAELTDSVIHAAASVKQIGDPDMLYSANVQATINLLEFTQLAKGKTFHYISTQSVLKNNPATEEMWGNHCTEEHLPQHLQKPENNFYLQTKLEAESYVIAYRGKGISTSIYRVGNLAFMLRGMSVQENINTVGFTHWLKYLLMSRSILPGVKIELSPVDLTANAIVKLFDKKGANNCIYHVFNPNLFDLSDFMQREHRSIAKGLSVNEFIQRILDRLERPDELESASRFLLAQGWLGVDGLHQFSQRIYLQNLTQSTLRKLSFEWPSIGIQQFKKYISQIPDAALQLSNNPGDCLYD